MLVPDDTVKNILDVGAQNAQHIKAVTNTFRLQHLSPTSM